MDLWGIGSGEILLVLLVALIVFGPNRVVEIGRTLGKIMNTVKRASSDFTSQMTRELDIEDEKPPPQIKPKARTRTRRRLPSKRQDRTTG
ncbi:twin-arginine translocase TatA/TatE family subunit [Bacteroidota bacterium]